MLLCFTRFSDGVCISLDISDSSAPSAPTDLASKETNMEVRVQDQERDPAGEVVQDSPNASSQSRRNSLKRKAPHDGFEFDEPSPVSFFRSNHALLLNVM